MVNKAVQYWLTILIAATYHSPSALGLGISVLAVYTLHRVSLGSHAGISWDEKHTGHDVPY